MARDRLHSHTTLNRTQNPRDEPHENLNQGDENGKTAFTRRLLALGLISTVLVLIFRLAYALNIIPPSMGAPGGTNISYTSFLHGAALFFLLAIASWCRTAKS